MVLVARKEIGLRALRRELSLVMDFVGDGNEVLVTQRGKPVATISKYRQDDVIERLRREGRITPAKHPKRPIKKSDLIPVKGSVSELLIADRERKRNP